MCVESEDYSHNSGQSVYSIIHNSFPSPLLYPLDEAAVRMSAAQHSSNPGYSNHFFFGTLSYPLYVNKSSNHTVSSRVSMTCFRLGVEPRQGAGGGEVLQDLVAGLSSTRL